MQRTPGQTLSLVIAASVVDMDAFCMSITVVCGKETMQTRESIVVIFQFHFGSIIRKE